MENTVNNDTLTLQKHIENMSDAYENDANVSGSSKESDENVDAIKRFIEDQTKEIENQKSAANKELAAHNETKNCDTKSIESKNYENSMISNVMGVILSDTEKLTQEKDLRQVVQQDLSTMEKCW